LGEDSMSVTPGEGPLGVDADGELVERVARSDL
jgi:hypothetical protein